MTDTTPAPSATAHRFPPITVAAVERPDPSTVVVVLDYDAAQSYSRAVDPAAMRKARGILGAGSWTLARTFDRGTAVPGEPVRAGTRCRRAYQFRESGALAREQARAVVVDVDQANELPEATPAELAALFGAA